MGAAVVAAAVGRDDLINSSLFPEKIRMFKQQVHTYVTKIST